MMKHKIITIGFCVILFGLFIANLVRMPQEESRTERRKLATLPPMTVENVFSGEYMRKFSSYVNDQFVLREPFRALKAGFDHDILRKWDTNDLFIVNGHYYKIDYPLKPLKIESAAAKIKKVQQLYLEGLDVYYAIIPDKNYFLEGPYLVLDYPELERLLCANLPELTYIRLFDALSVDDYFRTDSHWHQEQLAGVIEALGQGLGTPLTFAPANYEQQSYEPFYGVYYGQSARVSQPDTLVWLENETTRQAEVQMLGGNGQYGSAPIYQPELLERMDAYDVFLGGAQPLIHMKNPGNPTGGKLTIFRDSFTSSLAPLLLEGYAEITLVDLRYISAEQLGNFVDFSDQDILFLYSASLLNNSDLLMVR